MRLSDSGGCDCELGFGIYITFEQLSHKNTCVQLIFQFLETYLISLRAQCAWEVDGYVRMCDDVSMAVNSFRVYGCPESPLPFAFSVFLSGDSSQFWSLFSSHLVWQIFSLFLGFRKYLIDIFVRYENYRELSETTLITSVFEYYTNFFALWSKLPNIWFYCRH